MDVDQITDFGMRFFGAFFLVVLGLQYSIDLDIMTAIFTEGSTGIAVLGITTVVIGVASLYRLFKQVMGEF